MFGLASRLREHSASEIPRIPPTLNLDDNKTSPHGCHYTVHNFRSCIYTPHSTTRGIIMRIATLLSYAGGFKEAVAEVKALEKAGLDVVWVPEAY